MDHVVKSESEIRTRYQITIPEEIRTRAKLNIGDSLLWQYDEMRQEIIVMPKPKSFSDKLWGLGKDIWEQESAEGEAVQIAFLPLPKPCHLADRVKSRFDHSARQEC